MVLPFAGAEGGAQQPEEEKGSEGQNYLFYRADGQFSSIAAYYNGGDGAAVAYQAAFSYNGLGETAGIDYTNGLSGDSEVTYENMSWTYDSDGRQTSATGNAGAVSYGYDDAGELASVSYSADYAAGLGGTSQSFSYDGNGNQTGDTVTTVKNEVTVNGNWNYTYDNNGNMLTADNTVTGQDITYSYDFRNRLVKVADNDAPDVVYTYDMYNRMVSRTQSENNNASGGTWQPAQYYVYDGQSEVFAFGGPEEYSIPAIGHTMLWGPHNQLLAIDMLSSETDSGYTSWALTDNQGTVHDLLRTDEGTVVGIEIHIVYDAWGNILSTTDGVGFTFVWNGGLGFTSSFTDPTTHLVLNGYRWYDAALDRWLTQDPSGLGPDSNDYRYCGNDPVNEVDPSGLDGLRVAPPIKINTGATVPLQPLPGPAAGGGWLAAGEGVLGAAWRFLGSHAETIDHGLTILDVEGKLNDLYNTVTSDTYVQDGLGMLANWGGGWAGGAYGAWLGAPFGPLGVVIGGVVGGAIGSDAVEEAVDTVIHSDLGNALNPFWWTQTQEGIDNTLRNNGIQPSQYGGPAGAGLNEAAIEGTLNEWLYGSNGYDD